MGEQTSLKEQSPQDTGASGVPTKAVEWEWETALGTVHLSMDLVRRYFCKNATESEIMHFLAVAKYHKLNPWLRELYIIKYQDSEPASIVMGKWAHARKAEEHPQYAGTESGIIVQTQDGKLERRQGTFFLEPEKLLGGWAKVYRRDRERPELREVRLSDWFRVGPYWKSSPAHMINKVAVSQARHEAFPAEYADTISEEEAFSSARLVNEEIPQPKSVAEVAAVGHRTEPPPIAERWQARTESPAAPITPGESQGKESLEAHAGDPSSEEQEAIRQREHQEASGPVEKLDHSLKVNRGKVWNAVLRKSKAENKAANQVLQALTGKQSMAQIESDREVYDLWKKLGAI